MAWLREQVDEDERRMQAGWVPPVVLRRLRRELRIRQALVGALARGDGWEAYGPGAIEPEVVKAATAQELALDYTDRSGYREEWRP